MSQEQDIERWLRSQLFRSREKPLEKFVLFNANSGKTAGGPVEEFDIPTDEQIGMEQVPLMKDQIVAAAQRDADAAGSKLQMYYVVALELGAKTGARHRFRVRGEGEDDDAQEERTDKDGIVAQLMRHNEAMMRCMTMGQQQTISSLSRQLETQTALNEKLMEQRQAGFAALEEAKSAQHEREMQLMLAGGDEERKNATFAQIIAKLNTLFPIILNKMAGKNVLSPEETSTLKGFVNGLSPEQKAGIAQHLTNEQRIALMLIFREVENN